jgi:hypothetical protein
VLLSTWFEGVLCPVFLLSLFFKLVAGWHLTSFAYQEPALLQIQTPGIAMIWCLGMTTGIKAGVGLGRVKLDFRLAFLCLFLHRRIKY